jgi:predicted RNA-binding Zn-ribbon protein involved in translation (DUF1610 family)
MTAEERNRSVAEIPPEPACSACGYSLRGHRGESGICPECGTEWECGTQAIEETKAQDARISLAVTAAGGLLLASLGAVLILWSLVGLAIFAPGAGIAILQTVRLWRSVGPALGIAGFAKYSAAFFGWIFVAALYVAGCSIAIGRLLTATVAPHASLSVMLAAGFLLVAILSAVIGIALYLAVRTLLPSLVRLTCIDKVTAVPSVLRKSTE